MLRLSVAINVALVASLVMAAEPRPFKQPLDTFAEFRKISDSFAKAAKGPMDPAYRQALAERNEALARLAVESEKAPAPNHAVLSNIYMTLGRYDDAIRQLEIVLKSPAADSLFYFRSRLVDALLKAERLDDALAASRTSASVVVSLASANSYLRDFPYSLKQAIAALQKAGRGQDAAELMTLSTAQWNNAERLLAALPPTERSKYDSFTLRTTFDGLRRDLKLPAVAGAPARMDPPKPTAPPKPGAPTPPFDVQAEYLKIVGKFYKAAEGPEDPAFAQAAAERDAALKQLVAKGEQNKSDNHNIMAAAYATLKQWDDAARHLDLLVKESPRSFEARQRQVEALVGAKRWDDAVAAFRQATAIELSLDNAKEYIRHFPKSIAPLIEALVNEGRAKEGEALLTSCDAQLKTLHDQVAKLSDYKRNVEYPLTDSILLLFELRVRHWPTTVSASSIAAMRAGLPAGAGSAGTSQLGMRISDLLRAHSIEGPYFGSQENAEYLAKVKARREAFATLAAAADAEKVSNTKDLIFVYAAADRQADARREIEALLAANPGQYDKHDDVMLALIELSDPEPARDFLNRWIDTKVSLENFSLWATPLNPGSTGIRLVVERLVDAKLTADAKAAMARLQDKVKDLNARYKAAAVKPPGLTAAMVGNTLAYAGGISSALNLHLANDLNGTLARTKALGALNRAFLVNPKTEGRDSRPEYQEKVKARREAFAKFALQAEAAKSTEHGILMYVYAAADRQTEALREIDIVLSDEPHRFDRYDRIMEALVQLADPAPAIAFLNRWIDTKVTLGNFAAWVAPLNSGSFGGVSQVANRMGDAGRDEEARAALARIQSKIGELRRQFDTAAVKPPGVASTDFAAANNAISTAYSALNSWRDFHFNNSTGQLAFQMPLNVSREWDRLKARLSFQSHNTNTGPDFDRARANYLDGLSQLARLGDAEAAIDHATLAEIYSELKQRDDVLRHANLWLAKEPQSFYVGVRVSSLFDAQGLRDQAKTARDRALGLVIAPTEAKQYLGTSPSQVKSMCEAAMARGNLTEADDIARRWEAQLLSLRAAISGAKSDKNVTATMFATPLKMLDNLKRSLTLAHRREALVGKPYAPIAADAWLNGGPLTAEHTRGRVLAIQFWTWHGMNGAMTTMNAWQTEFDKQGLVVVGVSPRANVIWESAGENVTFRPKQDLTPAEADAEVTRFAEFRKWKSPLAIQADAKHAESYGLEGLAGTVIVDREGLVRHIIQGWNPEAQQRVRAALAETLGVKP